MWSLTSDIKPFSLTSSEQIPKFEGRAHQPFHRDAESLARKNHAKAATTSSLRARRPLNDASAPVQGLVFQTKEKTVRFKFILSNKADEQSGEAGLFRCPSLQCPVPEITSILPGVSWLFFKARPKRPYLNHTGRASNAEKQPTGPAQRVAMKIGRRLRCSSVTYRFDMLRSHRQSGSDRLADGPF